jgi:hypothetical protein
MTTWHHRDELCWVADCEVCDVPMVVWWRHGEDPGDEARERMLAALARVADERFGPDNWSVDAVMRQVPQHFHAHGRDRGWWQRRFGR